ncbi:MAG: biotin transporter BioY [Longimicrobiales bacterium]
MNSRSRDDVSALPLTASATGLELGRKALFAALAVVFVGTAAQLAVPVPGTPVPISLQDLAVLMVGVVLGPRLGAAALVAYLGVGAMGAPVFSNGHAGLPWLLAATGGYLLAYPAAAWIMGRATASRPRRLLMAAVGALAAQAVVYAGGVSQLMVLTGQDVATTAMLGVVPFLPGVVLKTGLILAFVAGLEHLAPRSGTDGPAGGTPPR